MNSMATCSALLLACSALIMACGGSDFTSAPPDTTDGSVDSSLDSDVATDSSIDSSPGLDVATDTTPDSDRPDSLEADSTVDGGQDSSQTDSAVQDSAIDASDSGTLCDSAEKLPSNAIYVSSKQPSSKGDGGPTNPYATIMEAVQAAEAAASASGNTIVLDEGAYTGPVLIASESSSIRIVGGWINVNGVWSKDCSDNARSKTTITSQTPTVVSINGAAQDSRIERVTINASATGPVSATDPAVSNIAILVQGNSSLTILGCNITAAGGGNGAAANKPVASGTPACTGKCGNGGAGADGPNGITAGAGVFSAAGFTPADGKDGLSGTNGDSGKQGGAGQSKDNCVTGCLQDTQCKTTLGIVAASAGSCGCGGVGGPGGGGGRGGGASVGILAVGSGALVAVRESHVPAGNGGNASPPTTGASPSNPSDGHSGADAWCITGNCGPTAQNPSGCVMPTSQVKVSGGTEGGTGGKGGTGGTGGGAAGGPSCAVAAVGGATVTKGAASTFVSGAGGSGSNGAPGGTSVKCTQP